MQPISFDDPAPSDATERERFELALEKKLISLLLEEAKIAPRDWTLHALVWVTACSAAQVYGAKDQEALDLAVHIFEDLCDYINKRWGENWTVPGRKN